MFNVQSVFYVFYVIVFFCRYVQEQIVMYPPTETMISYAISRNSYGLPSNPEDSKPDITHCQRLLCDVDSLYEVHDQVGVVFICHILSLRSYVRKTVLFELEDVYTKV